MDPDALLIPDVYKHRQSHVVDSCGHCQDTKIDAAFQKDVFNLVLVVLTHIYMYI